jgi:hypothetical protein
VAALNCDDRATAHDHGAGVLVANRPDAVVDDAAAFGVKPDQSSVDA